MTTPKYASKAGSATLERPRYSPGLLLEDDDLTSAVSYTRNMMRLMFRSLFGCGVICGLDVDALLTCNRTHVDVTIGKGVALDCTGDPIEIPKDFQITFDAKCDPLPEWLWVVVCYRETCCRPKDIACAPDDDGQMVQTRVKDGFEVRLYPYYPKCVCSCEKPPEGTPPTGHDCCADDEPPASSSSSSSATATAKTAQASTKSGPPATIAIPEGGGDQTTTAPERPTLPPLCDCYQSHYDGKCDCNCCCPCVLVGKVHTTMTADGNAVDLTTSDPQALEVDRDGVRWIRPVLTGYYKCIKEVATGTAVPVVSGNETPVLAPRPGGSILTPGGTRQPRG